ncbi:PLD nuclease N-terminal domain-containing protein [Streptomyces sp. NPDC003691]
MFRYLPFLLVLALWIYAFIDVLNTPEKEVRNLPKVAWVIIVLLFGEVLLGPIAWFVAGRPRRTPAYGGGGGSFSSGRRGGGWVAPDDNPDFLKSLDDEGKKDKPKDPKDEEPGSDGSK